MFSHNNQILKFFCFTAAVQLYKGTQYIGSHNKHILIERPRKIYSDYAIREKLLWLVGKYCENEHDSISIIIIALTRIVLVQNSEWF